MVPEVGLRQVFHLVVVVYFVFFDKFVFTVLIRDVTGVEKLSDELVVMTPQFATVWSQFLFQDYFLLSFLEDVLAWTPAGFWRPFKHILSEHANNLFTIYSLPITVVMSVNFWLVFYLDPRLIDEYHVLFSVLDRTTNHVVHTHVIAILLVEMCITPRVYPSAVTVVKPYFKIALCMAVYFSAVFAMKLFSPIWPYPFFRLMSAGQWVFYTLGNTLLAFIAYAVGFYCNAFVWGKRGDAASGQTSSQEGGWKAWTKLLRLLQVVESR